jgi:nucleotide-binding universal stress UspA family protein
VERTVIWATDGSEGAWAALEPARALAEALDGRIVAVHCDQDLFPGAAWSGAARVRRQVEALGEAGLALELVVRRSRREAADVVAALARDLDADAIACGAHGRHAQPGVALGSFTQRLLEIAPCPVLTAPEPEAAPRRELALGARVQGGTREAGGASRVLAGR